MRASLRRRLRPLLLAALATGGAGVLGAGPAPAQELGVRTTLGRSQHPELPSPLGVGVYFEVETPTSWVFGLGLARTTDHTQKEGLVCQVYAPRVGCQQELVTTEPRLLTLGLYALRTVVGGRRLRVAVGGGPTFNALAVNAVGTSGRDADLFKNKALQLGGRLELSVGSVPLDRMPIRLSVTAARHWIQFRACAAPGDPGSGYDPFCGLERLNEMEVAAAFLLPRMPGW